MTTSEFLTIIGQVAGVFGIVASMLATGLGLTVAQIVQPLKNIRLLVLVLLANFVLVPLLAVGIMRIIPLDDSLKVVLLIVAASAGAPPLVLEARAAKGNMGVAVAVMVLLMVVTVFYLPVVLPLLLTGIEVDSRGIAQSLIVGMLIPLIVGLIIKAHAPDTAQNWAPMLSKAGLIGVLLLLVIGLGLNLSNVLGLIGTRGFLALLLLVFGGLLIGFAIGGRDPSIRNVMGLATAQRNVSAAILIVLQNFAGTDAVPYVLVAAALIMLVLLGIAPTLGARSKTADVPVAQAP